MTKHTKANLVGSIFVIIGLYGTIAHAKPEIKEKSQQAFAINNISMQANSSLLSISYRNAYPSITSEIFKENNKISKTQLIQLPQQLLLGMQVVDFAHLVPNKFEKKNTIFEFATKFNDALQKILVYVGFSSTSANRNNDKVSEKNINKQIRLTDKHEKAFFKQDCMVIEIK